MTATRQLTIFSGVVVIVSVASLLYVSFHTPEALTRTRNGTPFFLPPVENPDGGDPIAIDELVRHFKEGG